MIGTQTQPTSTTDAGTRQERNTWLVLAVLAGAIFVVPLDSTIANVAQVKGVPR